MAEWRYPSEVIKNGDQTFELLNQKWVAGRVAITVREVGETEVHSGMVYAANDEGAAVEIEVLQQMSNAHCVSYEMHWQDERFAYVLTNQKSQVGLTDKPDIPHDSVPGVFIQMLYALSHLHSLGYAHCSLVPASFSITPLHSVQLCSFYSAQHLTGALRKEDIADLSSVLQRLYNGKPPDTAKKLVSLMVQHAPQYSDIMKSEYIMSYVSKATVTFVPHAKHKYVASIAIPGSQPFTVPLPGAHVDGLVGLLLSSQMQDDAPVIDFTMLQGGKAVPKANPEKSKKSKKSASSMTQMKLDFSKGTPTKPAPDSETEEDVGQSNGVSDKPAKKVKTLAPVEKKQKTTEKQKRDDPPAGSVERKRKWATLSNDDCSIVWSLANCYASGGDWKKLKKLRPEGFYSSRLVEKRLRYALTVAVHRQGE